MKSRSTVREIAADAQLRLDEDASAVRVLLQFRQIFNTVKTHFQHVEKSVGLGGAQLWALGVIQGSPGIGTGALAARLNIHQSTASNLVGALAQRQLVSGIKDAGDKRATKWQLLPAGAELLARSPGPFSGLLPQALGALDEEVLLRLQADLRLLLNELGADEKAKKIPLSEI